jgi:hypothetical protein
MQQDVVFFSLFWAGVERGVKQVVWMLQETSGLAILVLRGKTYEDYYHYYNAYHVHYNSF